MKVVLLLSLCLVPLAAVFAQEKGSVSIHQDPRLAMLLSKTKVAETEDSDEEELAPKAAATRPLKAEKSEKPPKYVYEPDKIAKDVADNLKKLKKENSPKPTPERPSNAAPSGERFTGKYVSGYSPGGRFSGKGFRVQIYYGSNRNEALRRKAEFMRNYPGVNTYFLYIAPNYRVKVGDFRRREDAMGMYREANDSYSPCMIVPDIVNIK